MWWGYHGFWCFGFALFFLVLFALFILFMVRLFSGSNADRRWKGDKRNEARLILQRRLASGEISEEEYLRLKEHLEK